MRSRTIVWLLAATVATREAAATTPVPPDALVDLRDYPPYFDALSSEVSRAGLSGSETIPGMSVLDDGVRVMPVKVGVSGELAQIAALLTKVSSEGFPFRSRVGELSLGRSLEAERPDAAARPFHAELMLLAPVRPREGQPVGDEVASRVAEDVRHGEALGKLLRGILAARSASPWLLTLRVDGLDVAIEGTIPDRTSAESLVERVVSLDGFVVSQVIGPQVDPDSKRNIFLALGRLASAPASSGSEPR